MRENTDPGLDALQRIARLWDVNDDRVNWVDRSDSPFESYEFEWWPGNHCVSVQSHKWIEDGGHETWRLTVQTAFLKDVAVEDPKTRNVIALMSTTAPTYAWVYTPPEVTELCETEVDRTLRFQSTVYLRRDTASWLPEFFGKIAILQPIAAQWQAKVSAEMLRAHPDVSSPSDNASPDYLDGMLDVARMLYVPAGQEPSRWERSGEFEEIAKRYGKNDSCFGTAGPSGATLETPFGSMSALIRVRSDEKHPALGAGLLASLQLPLHYDAAESLDLCMWLNFNESIRWSGVPQLGSWWPQEKGNGKFRAASSTFYPNALHQAGLAANAALWQVARARWVKEQYWPNLQDLPMIEILRRNTKYIEFLSLNSHDRLPN